MTAALTRFQDELSTLRTGRATPGLLAPVSVRASRGAHGHAHSDTRPLSAYGTVTVRGPALLVVSLYNDDVSGLRFGYGVRVFYSLLTLMTLHSMARQGSCVCVGYWLQPQLSITYRLSTCTHSLASESEHIL